MTRRNTTLALPEDGGGHASAMLPAYVIDVAAGSIVAANAAGRRAWGGGAATGTGIAIPVDRAMPALGRLAEMCRSGAAATLVLWSPRGLLPLYCQVRPVPGAQGRYLVQALPGGAAPVRQPGPAAALAGGDADEARLAALARLAHEVRTPLGAAIAYAEVLKDEHFGPLGSARYREYARTIYDSARHALGVVDGMLSGATDPAGGGLPELAFRDLDPAGIMDDCVAVARPLAERAGLALAVHVGSGTPRVIADEVSLKQMLLNLITNAIKFARPGDRITLRTAHGADGGLRIEVADTGPGMEPPPGASRAAAAPGASTARKGAVVVRHPSQPKAAVRTDGAGQGIGLPLTRALAEANGATLIVDSTPGRGTRVVIAFGKDRVVPV